MMRPPASISTRPFFRKAAKVGLLLLRLSVMRLRWTSIDVVHAMSQFLLWEVAAMSTYSVRIKGKACAERIVRDSKLIRNLHET